MMLIRYHNTDKYRYLQGIPQCSSSRLLVYLQVEQNKEPVLISLVGCC